LALIRDKTKIEKAVKKILSEHQKAVTDFKAGKKTAIQFLIGQVMRETKGRADPKIVENLLAKILKKV